MKKILIWVACLAAVLMITGCAKNEPEAQITEPIATEPATQAPTQAPSEDPFEYESEIDFSDFETLPTETQQPTEPEEATTEPTKPTVKPTNPPVKPTEPEVEPTTAPVQPTEPEIEPTTPPVESTEPEESQPPASTAPSIGADGYYNQIVKP